MTRGPTKFFTEIISGLFFFGLLISALSFSATKSTGQERDELIADDQSTTPFEARLDHLFEYCRNNSDFSGSVLIAHHGNVVFKKSFGFADVENEVPNSLSTNFNVASTTKPFTAMAVAILADRKKLNFDNFVCDYLPEFPYPSVSIRHLLTHTSGLPDYLHSPPFFKYHRAAQPDSTELPPFTNKDILRWLVNSGQDLSFEPGSRMNYSNTGYVMLALIVEKVSNQKFSAYVKKNVLNPSGMSNSVMYSLVEDPPIANRAIGHTPTLDRTSFVPIQFNRMDGIVGDSGLYSSVEDLFKFDQALYSSDLVSPEILDEIFTPCRLNDGQIKGYGLGWILTGHDESGPIVIKHGGKGPGIAIAFQRMIEDSSTVIILTNCGYTGPTIGSIRDAAANILQGMTPTLPKFPVGDKIAKVLFEAGADSAAQLYQFLAEYKTDMYIFDEQQLNFLGYELLYENRLEDALVILETNAKAYPKSSNVYDSLGDIYTAAGDTLKAIAQYGKALSTDPALDHTIEKLIKISHY